jgi:CRISPR-associated protein Csm1
MITLADRLSSGERESLPEDDSQKSVSDTPLTCLFTKLEGTTGGLDDWPMRALEPDLTPWFSPGPHKTNYPVLWAGFNDAVAKLDKVTDFDLLFQQLMSRLEKYTFFMPSAAYRDRPDISLYHHLKATAALAGCLYDLEIGEGQLDELLAALKGSPKNQPALEQEAFMLVAADVSGIQDFIYSVTSKKALKGLKGRSLYLELLGQSTAWRILGELELPLANLLFLGGGHFYLILPNANKVKSVIQAWQERVNDVLVGAHGGRLALVLHDEPVTYRNLLRAPAGQEKEWPGFADIWRIAAAGLAREKRRKFNSSWSDLQSVLSILGPFSSTGEESACSVCGEELSTGSEEICDACMSFADLASRAAAARFIEFSTTAPEPLNLPFSSYEQVFQALGVRYRFHSEAPSRPVKSLILNQTDIFTSQGPCRGFIFMAHHVPREIDGSVKTLEELARAATGIKKWGVMRADVDNLGQVFTERLGTEDRTLSRLSTLSSLLSLFFSAHVQNLIRQEYGDSVYLVYAGGDDLCLLAPWSILPVLAQRLRDDFARWTRGRLSLSAGLYLAPRDKFPVYQAAGEAGDLMAQAKHEGKDRVGIFDQAVTWKDMATLETLRNQLVALLKDYGVPRALLSMLMASWQENQLHSADSAKLPFYRVWRLLYGLRRLIERLGQEKKTGAISALTELEQTLIINHHLRPHTDIAIRWADYLTRE